ncbi:MAG: hypothetical protein AAFV93_19795 [Chloroflexota bacterium]
MPDTITVFVPSDEIVPKDELYELTAIEDITEIYTLDNQLEGYRIAWDDVELVMRVPAPDVQEAKIDNFLAITDELLDGRRDKKAKKIWRRAERMVQMVECTVTPDWDEARKAQLLVQGLMAFYDYALMFAKGAVYNENGNIEVGREDSKLKYWVDPVEKSSSGRFRRCLI